MIAKTFTIASRHHARRVAVNAATIASTSGRRTADGSFRERLDAGEKVDPLQEFTCVISCEKSLRSHVLSLAGRLNRGIRC